MLAKDHVHCIVFTGFLLPGIGLSIEEEKGVTEDEMVGIINSTDMLDISVF